MKRLLPANLGKRLVRTGQYAFAAIGIVALGYWASVSVNAHLFQRKEAQSFARNLQTQGRYEEKSARTVPITKIEQQEPVEGAVIANLAIPRLGLSTMVVEGVEDRDLKLGAGHIPGTALPGNPGNIGIAGHRDTIFRPLRLIHKGDAIALTTLHGEVRYRVVSTETVSPDDVQVLYPTRRDTLTLVTCYPFYFVGSAPQRFIVLAERLDEPARSAAKKESFMAAPATMKSNPTRLIAFEPAEEADARDGNRQSQHK